MSIDYHQYLASREWKIKTRQSKKRSDGKCQRCWLCKATQTDHLTYKSLGHESMQDIASLCAPCHEWRSGKTIVDPVLFATVCIVSIVRAMVLKGPDWNSIRKEAISTACGHSPIIIFSYLGATLELGHLTIRKGDYSVLAKARTIYGRAFDIEPEEDEWISVIHEEINRRKTIQPQSGILYWPEIGKWGPGSYFRLRKIWRKFRDGQFHDHISDLPYLRFGTVINPCPSSWTN